MFREKLEKEDEKERRKCERARKKAEKSQLKEDKQKKKAEIEAKKAVRQAEKGKKWRKSKKKSRAAKIKIMFKRLTRDDTDEENEIEMEELRASRKREMPSRYLDESSESEQRSKKR